MIDLQLKTMGESVTEAVLKELMDRVLSDGADGVCSAGASAICGICGLKVGDRDLADPSKGATWSNAFAYWHL